MNLELILNRSKSIIDLEDNLRDYGHKFKDCKEYVKFLDEEWNKILKPKEKEIISDALNAEKEGLPNLTTEKEGVTYNIHGIVHGWPLLLAPGWHPRKKLKRVIEEEAQYYLFEENFHNAFKLNVFNELHDVTCTKKKIKSCKDILEIGLSVTSGMLGLFVLPPIFLKGYIRAKSIKNPTLKNGFFYFAQKSLSEPSFQNKFLKFKTLSEMPQPFELEKGYLKEKNRTLLNLIMGCSRVATSSERSLWTARKLNFMVKAYNLKNVHYLCGMGHATPIIYFLHHQDYSFTKLEEYRLKTK